MVEIKGLKQVERKGLKKGIIVIHQVKIHHIDQSIKLFQVSVKNGSWREILPSVGACRLYVGKPSVILRRLI